MAIVLRGAPSAIGANDEVPLRGTAAATTGKVVALDRFQDESVQQSLTGHLRQAWIHLSLREEGKLDELLKAELLPQPLTHRTCLEEINDGLWNIIYYKTLLGRFDERTKKITGAPSLREKC